MNSTILVLVVLVAVVAVCEGSHAKLIEELMSQGARAQGSSHGQHRKHHGAGQGQQQKYKSEYGQQQSAGRAQKMNQEEIKAQQGFGGGDDYDYYGETCNCDTLDTFQIQVAELTTRLDQIEASSRQTQSTSCAELKTLLPDNAPSGFYDLIIGGVPQNVFCNFDELCGDDGGWLRVGHLDMDNGGTCPGELQTFSQDDKRSCGRSGGFCQSIGLNTHGATYSKVCGRVTGYQLGSTDALEIHSVGQRDNIDGGYVDGVSITKGSPREHIWTYVSSLTENIRWCPCDVNSNARPLPSFVGNDYYCEAAILDNWNFNTLYTDDLLWDGQQCGEIQEPCCQAARNSPHFLKELSAPSDDFLELRVCGDEPVNNENVAVNFYEIYVKE